MTAVNSMPSTRANSPTNASPAIEAENGGSLGNGMLDGTGSEDSFHTPSSSPPAVAGSFCPCHGTARTASESDAPREIYHMELSNILGFAGGDPVSFSRKFLRAVRSVVSV